MPSEAKSTLRGRRVFGVFDEQGEPLCWVGRNLNYEEQMAKLRPGDEAPGKYRFPWRKLGCTWGKSFRKRSFTGKCEQSGHLSAGSWQARASHPTVFPQTTALLAVTARSWNILRAHDTPPSVRWPDRV